MANLTAVERVPLCKIATNPNNPRAEFDEEKLEALADSFAANGGRPFTPLLVVRDGSRYMIAGGSGSCTLSARRATPPRTSR